MSESKYDYWYEGKAATEDILNPFGKVMDKAGAVCDGTAVRVTLEAGENGTFSMLVPVEEYFAHEQAPGAGWQ